MPVIEQAKKQLDQKQQEKKATIQAFKSLFLSPSQSAELVLRKLSEMCKENEPTYVDQNPNGTAYREGQRSIILGIRKMLNKDLKQERQGKAKI